MLTIIGIAVLVIVLFVIFLVTYKVVDPDEAHVVVRMGKGRKLYAPRLKAPDKEGRIPSPEGVKEIAEAERGSKTKTAYFYIPFIMKRAILPLTNVKIDINDIHLNDVDVAPFVCDVIAWINIYNPVKAAERLLIKPGGETFDALRQDLINIVQAIARTTAMKQDVLGIMRDRETFSRSVSKEVDSVLDSWGIQLVNLEVNDIRDDDSKGSTVISDYEAIRKAQVNAQKRKEVALRDREAVEVEQQNLQQAEIAKAKAEEEYRKRQIEKDKQVGIADQTKEQEVAEAQEKANAQKVEANRTLTVGNAQVERDATIEKATGEAEAVRVTGEKEANVVQLKGEAEGKAIEAKGTAEAIAKDKMAEAMKKFNEAATAIEKIRAWIEVQKAMYEAYGKVAENAEIKVVNSGRGGNILGFPMNAESGADLGQMFEAAGGLDKALDAIKNLTGKNGTLPKEREGQRTDKGSQPERRNDRRDDRDRDRNF